MSQPSVTHALANSMGLHQLNRAVLQTSPLAQGMRPASWETSPRDNTAYSPLSAEKSSGVVCGIDYEPSPRTSRSASPTSSTTSPSTSQLPPPVPVQLPVRSPSKQAPKSRSGSFVMLEPLPEFL